MNIITIYDVFIAFHNSGDDSGSGKQAEAIYKYLTENGIKCFLFTESIESIYKANFVKIMQSKLLLMVCNSNIALKSNGEIDFRKNYHLYVELDSFFALTQSDAFDKSINDSAILYFANDGNHKLANSPEQMHPLFNNRNSFYFADGTDDEDAFENVLDWVEDRLDVSYDDIVEDELITILSGRGSNPIERRFGSIDFHKVMRHAVKIKCIGISNWTFSLTDGCRKLIRALKKGTEVEMLFLDPDGVNCRIRSEEEKKNTRTQIQDSFDMIQSELLKHFHSDRRPLESLHIFTYDLIPRDNLIFVYTENDAYVFVQNYSHSMPGSANPCLVIRRKADDSSPLFEYYEKVYNNVKDNGVLKPVQLFDI